MKQWLRIRWAWINSSRIIYAGYMTLFMTLFMHIVFYSWFGYYVSDDPAMQRLAWIGFPMFFAPPMFLMHLQSWHPLSEMLIKKEIKKCPDCDGFGYFRVKCKCCDGDGWVKNEILPDK